MPENAMKEKFTFLTAMSYLVQVGISVALPLVLCILAAVWIRNRFETGGWVIAIGLILGLLGAAGGLIGSLRSLHRLGKNEKNPPEGFNGF